LEEEVGGRQGKGKAILFRFKFGENIRVRNWTVGLERGELQTKNRELRKAKRTTPNLTLLVRILEKGNYVGSSGGNVVVWGWMRGTGGWWWWTLGRDGRLNEYVGLRGRECRRAKMGEKKFISYSAGTTEAGGAKAGDIHRSNMNCNNWIVSEYLHL
jgi:hypothetical protein